MRIVGRGVLEGFMIRHADVRSAVEAWFAEVSAASWDTPVDLRRAYPSASFVKQHVIFNLRHNRYRLDVVVAYKTKTVLIKRIGTHADYDRWEF